MFQQMLQQAFDNLHQGKNELALLSIMPIFDKACKKTWPREGVGKRFRRGVEDTEDIITFIMLGGRGTMINCTFGDKKLPELIYKYLRNTIIHEGVMPTNVTFKDEPLINIGKDSIQLPIQFVYGLLIASIGFDCYKNEASNVTQIGKLSINNQDIYIKDIVGNHQIVRDAI